MYIKNHIVAHSYGLISSVFSIYKVQRNCGQFTEAEEPALTAINTY